MTDAQLADAIRDSRGGDRILLAPGTYGRVLIYEAGVTDYPQVRVGSAYRAGAAPNLDDFVTVTSQDPDNMATINSAAIRANYWRFAQLNFFPGLGKGINFTTFVSTGHHVEVLRSTFDNNPSDELWTGQQWLDNAASAIRMNGSDSRMVDNTVRWTNFGLVLQQDAHRSSVIGNTVQHIAGDAMSNQANCTEFIGNNLSDFVIINGNHDDCLQNYSREKGKVGNGELTGVRIVANRCYASTDPNDPIYTRTDDPKIVLDAPPETSNPQGYSDFDSEANVDFVVEGNWLTSTAYHGISFNKPNTRGMLVRDNRIIDINPSIPLRGGSGSSQMWVRVTNAPTNIVINNVTNRVFHGQAANRTVNYADYNSVFVDWRNNDLSLAGSALSGASLPQHQGGAGSNKPCH